MRLKAVDLDSKYCCRLPQEVVQRILAFLHFRVLAPLAPCAKVYRDAFKESLPWRVTDGLLNTLSIPPPPLRLRHVRASRGQPLDAVHGPSGTIVVHQRVHRKLNQLKMGMEDILSVMRGHKCHMSHKPPSTLVRHDTIKIFTPNFVLVAIPGRLGPNNEMHMHVRPSLYSVYNTRYLQEAGGELPPRLNVHLAKAMRDHVEFDNPYVHLTDERNFVIAASSSSGRRQ
ncbi:unnamed protein product [Vitrella brassicaformis CCMP3155]|uniref:F-box domain-containing protein n=1 Tax=Vitrella brassicaformis (strain CCMP3155) TaxID=1169540 RepID=A0A0G4GIF3_VITBC|nr:unnamed protein product [Vitrella brassicaformis CCMP3155]|mmetsp:Transcript_39549/g.99056  ORF Transcript_39549/g.99056 Transcript_39549/m.99056 type:complete len:228 (-) Transcript_39549:185-868(-)|eukprot:CEM29648.1 unnamed protein product [Vitrella brassicaformis CCMP3155]